LSKEARHGECTVKVHSLAAVAASTAITIATAPVAAPAPDPVDCAVAQAPMWPRNGRCGAPPIIEAPPDPAPWTDPPTLPLDLLTPA
jgi:hypothetical protein